MGLGHIWQLQLAPRGFSARAWAGRAWSELRRQRDNIGVLCSEVRNSYVKCTGKPTVQPTPRCSVRIVWKGMCWLGQWYQGYELPISEETGEKEVDWMVQRSANFLWFLEAPEDLMVLGGDIGVLVHYLLLFPTPHKSVPSHKLHGEGGGHKDMESGLVTHLPVCLHPGEISASTTPWPQPQGSGTCGCVGREMSALRVAQVAHTAYSHPFQEKGQAKPSTCAKAVAARAFHDFTASSSACASILPSWSEGELIWNDKLCLCIYTQ